jgi:hypothetical protein
MSGVGGLPKKEDPKRGLPKKEDPKAIFAFKYEDHIWRLLHIGESNRKNDLIAESDLRFQAFP